MNAIPLLRRSFGEAFDGDVLMAVDSPAGEQLATFASDIVRHQGI